MSFETGGSCKSMGAVHRVKNCVNGTCVAKGECQSASLVRVAQEMGPLPLLRPAETIPIPATALPTDKQARKDTPIGTGVLDYFPAALAEVARCSKAGNDQHNPGQPLHWARGKSADHFDAMVRHGMERGTVDDDGIRHSAKAAWRALAQLQQELEDAGLAPVSRGSA
jgi:hypothetical protein